jgi:TRAP-type transport system periplasmic protein
MKKTLQLALPLLLLLVLATPARADVTLKLATLAPEGTTWYRALREMCDEWKEISEGDVTCKIYAGGVVGNETIMVRKMRIGQLHGGQITSLGLGDYDPAPAVLQTPLLIRNNAELDHIMGAMTPMFEERMAEHDIVVLNWGDAGWIHLFTKTPMTDPADAKNFTIYAIEGDPDAVKLYEIAGFKPVVMASTDVLPALQSGLVDAFPSTRLGALSMQWFALSNNMIDVPWAPLMGATIITNDAWAAIPEGYHDSFKAVATRIGEEVKGEIRRQDEKSVSVMEKYGLTVHPVDEQTRQAWEAVGIETHSVMRGKIVPEDVFDEAMRVLEVYRAAQ